MFLTEQLQSDASFTVQYIAAECLDHESCCSPAIPYLPAAVVVPVWSCIALQIAPALRCSLYWTMLAFLSNSKEQNSLLFWATQGKGEIVRKESHSREAGKSFWYDSKSRTHRAQRHGVKASPPRSRSGRVDFNAPPPHPYLADSSSQPRSALQEPSCRDLTIGI